LCIRLRGHFALAPSTQRFEDGNRKNQIDRRQAGTYRHLHPHIPGINSCSLGRLVVGRRLDLQYLVYWLVCYDNSLSVPGGPSFARRKVPAARHLWSDRLGQICCIWASSGVYALDYYNAARRQKVRLESGLSFVVKNYRSYVTDIVLVSLFPFVCRQ